MLIAESFFFLIINKQYLPLFYFRKLLQGYLDSQNAKTTTEPLDNVDPISAPVNPVSAPDPDRDTQQDLPTEETAGSSTEYFTGKTNIK